MAVVLFDPKATSANDLTRAAMERGTPGTIALGSKGRGWIAPMRQATKRQPKVTDVPGRMVAQMMSDLPPVIRRTPRERYKALLDRLIEDGLKSYRVHGYPVWPKSIQQELYALGWKDGDPNLWGQIEALARKFITEGANKQKEKDQGKVALDWHGHYSA